MDCLNVEGGISMLCRNVGKQLPTRQSAGVVCTAAEAGGLSANTGRTAAVCLACDLPEMDGTCSTIRFNVTTVASGRM